ncbi:hypothetical protein [Glutamicibacter ardleyensis]|uniref:hypothetical protein n=1 Tax=Glutamicibacter ardleyensis TaxID=225894 RepID=UPI003FD12775
MTETGDDFARSDVFVTSFCHFPGQEPMEIHKVVRGELGEPNLAVMPQLAERGVGADPLGRSTSMVSDMGFDLQPHGWRIGVGDGIDARRARSFLRSDENLLADVLGAEKKPAQRLKVSVLGPWSLAAGLYLSHGERILIDHGARRDILQAYADGVKQHLLRLRSSTSIRQFTVQLDEPELPGVLDGTLPTASGYRTLRSIPRAEVREVYAQFVQTMAQIEGTSVIVNLPGADTDWIKRVDILHQAGVNGYLIEPPSMNHPRWERMASLIESGSQIYLQLLTPGMRAPGVVEGVHHVLRPWQQLGLPLTRLGQLTLMPATSFAHSSSSQVIECLQHLTGYAQALEQTRVDA